MISRLFRSKPRLDSKAADDRRSAIEALSEAEAQKCQADLGRLAREDSDPGVRGAAIGRLQDEQALAALLDDAELGDRVVARVLALNAAGSCLALADAPRVLAAGLPLAEEPGPLAARLIELGGHGLLIDALLGASREQREALLTLPQLKRVDVLQELERRSRDRDKRTNRFARAGLEEFREQTAARDRLMEALEERLSNLEKPSDDDSALERERRTVVLGRVEENLAELADLTARLAGLGADTPATAPLRQRYEQLQRLEAQAQARAATEAAAEAAAGPAADEPQNAEGHAADKQPPAQGNTDFDTLTTGFQALDQAMTGNGDFEALAAQRQALTQRWLASADHAPPSAAQHAVFEAVSHRFAQLSDASGRLAESTFVEIDPSAVPEKLSLADGEAWRAVDATSRALNRLSKTLKHISWPDWAAVPEALATQQALAADVRARLDNWQQRVADTTSELGAALEALEALIDAGELKSAKAEAGRIRKQLKHMPERTVSSLNRQLTRASARLGELGDWQTFATTPKREALLADMSTIADSPLPPADQARRIKALREEWNNLGPIGRTDDHKLLDAFNEAAERAFEPCRSHFAAQAEVRAANLAAREAICDSLAQYLAATDWANADFKAAERIMRTAREEWRAHHPVDRSAGKALEARFEGLQADLHEQIKAEWDRNLESKRQIVAEAQALAASEAPVPEQVEGAKRLQQRWKAVGSTPRRPDQTLWRDFRAACDAIFEHRESVKRSEDAQIQADREAARQLLDDFRQRLDDAASATDPAALRDFQARFAELPALPERMARAFERERDELVRTAEQAVREQRMADARARLENLKGQDAEVAALEQRLLAGETLTFTAPDPLFADRCQPDGEPVPTETLTRLVIEAEIAAALDSPETELRMSLQVELMNAGRGREALAATPEALTKRWCELGPKDASADPLRDRFFLAIAELLRR